MFGAKSKPPSRLVARSGSCSSSLKKPAATVSSGGQLGVQQQQRQSGCNLAATGTRSSSRSSILSDTGASTCSVRSGSRSTGLLAARTGTTVNTATLVRSSGGTTITSIGTSSSPAAATTTTATKTKTGPSSVGSTNSSSAVSSSASAVGAAARAVSSSSSSRRAAPTLAMSLREKDQQIKLLIKEREEQKFQAELMARRAEEWQEKFLQSEVERSHVTSEADDEVVELRRLAQELEDENKRLAGKLGEREQAASDTQFKLDEIEIERNELRRELEDREELLKQMEREREELLEGRPVVQVTSERAISQAKYEREIEELREKIMARDEQLIQLRTSLEMRKNEVTNLQAHAGDLERKLKIESERSERHLKRIDETNLELKACEAKLATKSEESEMQERQVRQLRQELRAAEEKLEQVSLARKKDVDILHNKLSVARRGSTTPTSPQPYKTPTPQDEIVRLQMEIRDLKDQLIDREAELDCNRRDIEVMRRKMETRTLEVDCNNQELARRCQDLLEQNRQSEDTVKQLLKSTTEHSAQLMRATEDLKEANGKCKKLREELQELESKLDAEVKRADQLARENSELKEENEEQREQVEMLRQRVESLNEQISDLCEQLDHQTNTLHKDREALADQLSRNEIDSAQVRHDLATAKQDLRSSRLQTQEVASERDRLRAELGIKEKYIVSRNDIIETMRHELEDCKKSLGEYKQKIEELRALTSTQHVDQERSSKELRAQLELLKRDCQTKTDESAALRARCEQLQEELVVASAAATTTSLNDDSGSDREEQEEEQAKKRREEELKRFDEMRREHSAELDALKLKIKDLEEQLEEAKSLTLKRDNGGGASSKRDKISSSSSSAGSQLPADCNGNVVVVAATASDDDDNEDKLATSCDQPKQSDTRREEYETQIEFLNSLVVDMQRKCDDYKNRLAQMETMNIMKEFDNLIMCNQPTAELVAGGGRASTMRRAGAGGGAPLHQASAAYSVDEAPVAQTATLTRQTAPSSAGGKRVNIIAPTKIDVHGQSNGNGNTNGHMTVDKPVRISGRPYCDICRVFDLHHTIYCPKVSEKLASRGQVDGILKGNNNNNNNNNNYVTGYNNNVDDLFREYEQSIERASLQQFASLRRPVNIEKPPRPYCDHCDLFGHTIKSCSALRA